MRISRIIALCSALFAALTLVPVARAQNGACCNLATGACAANAGNGAADCLCGTTYRGDGSVCSPTLCSQGACCTLATSVCSLSSQAQCPLGSAFIGVGTTCPSSSCAAAGSCCNTRSGGCTTVRTSGNCLDGTFTASATCAALCGAAAVCCNPTTGVCTVRAVGATGCAVATTILTLGSSSCTTNPCLIGVCCDAATGTCAAALNSGTCSGTFIASGACTPSPCTAKVCCNTSTGACAVMTAAGCPVGTTTPAAASCSPYPCPAAVCCDAGTGACAAITSSGCFVPAVRVAGTCSPYPCPVSVCCNTTTGACAVTLAAGCAAGTSLASGTCPAGSLCGGACCNSTTGACTQVLVNADCTVGTFTPGFTCTNTATGFTVCGSTLICCATTGNPVCTFMSIAAGCPAGTMLLTGTCAPTDCARFGACCTGVSTCASTTSADCSSGFWVDGGLCTASNGPCGTGACCTTSGTCSVVDASACTGTSVFLGNGVACATNCFAETEGNDARNTPNPAIVMADGDVFCGYSITSTSPGTDYFVVQPAAATPGIYKHTLAYACANSPTSGYTSSNTHALTIKGLSSADGVADYRMSLAATQNATLQTGTQALPFPMLRWYGFGGSEPVSLLVNGQAPGFGQQSATPSAYRMTLTSTPITPTDIGSIAGGLVTITTLGQPATVTNTAMWVYDSTFHPIPGCGNDDIPSATNHTFTQAQLTYEFLTEGDYYLALSDQTLALPLTAPTPPLDRADRNNVCDPGSNIVVCSSVTPTLVMLNYSIKDGTGAITPHTASKTGAFEVVWIKFHVNAPAGGTGACCKPDGSCVIASSLGCTTTVSTGGVVVAGYAGTYTAGAPCASITCAQPPAGACCQLDGTCTSVSSFACTSYTGAWRGAGSACAAQACPGTVSSGSFVFDNTHVGLTTTAAGIFVDVTAGADPILVTRIDYYAGGLNSYLNAPLNANGTIATPMHMIIYARDGGGSSANNEFNSTSCAPQFGSNWVMNTDTGKTIPCPGFFTPVPVALSTPVPVPATQTQGFLLAPQSGGVDVYNAGPSTFVGTGGVGMTSLKGRATAGTSPGWNTSPSTSQNTFNGRIYFVSTGACCAANGSCTITTADACAPGTFLSLGLACAPNVCPGVCCRGATCNATVAFADCVTTGFAAGANFSTAGATCNAGGSYTTPCCYADYNKVNGKTVADIFSYLSDWFAHSHFAVSGGDGLNGTPVVADIFNFLSAWFGGC